MKLAGGLGIVFEVERSKPRLVTVVDVAKGGTVCGDCATLVLVVGTSPGDDIEKS